MAAFCTALACFFAGLTFVNCFWACYPNDNDLDEVGWLAAHLDLARPESLANQGYPPGLPLVLRGLTPLVGSFLQAAFLWQSMLATAAVFFVFRISLSLSRRAGVAAVAAVCAGLAILPVATSEFADGTSTALLLGGLWLLTRRSVDQRGLFLMGLGCGLAYLFRTHYLVLIAVVPASLVLAGFGLTKAARLSLCFAAGFAATAWPLWLLNVLAYGTPLHAGVSQYNIALQIVPNALNWEDYPNTYNQWPLSRVLREHPLDLVRHLRDTAIGTLTAELSLAGVALGALGIWLDQEKARRRMVAFIGLLMLLYIVTVIVPTRFTQRAYAPVAMLACILMVNGVAQLALRSPWPRATLLAAAGALGFLAYRPWDFDQLDRKRANLEYNRQIVDVLVANGMQSSEEVFSNIWNMYNLADPAFITFYNYGGWITLDSKYNAERPVPRAHTLAEWENFFDSEQLRFAILQRRGDNEALFQSTPESWKQLLSDNYLTVWALNPALAEASSWTAP